MSVERPLRVLIVEDNDADYLLAERYLSRSVPSMLTERAATMTELESALWYDGPWDVIVSDYAIPPQPFIDYFSLIQRCLPDVPVILMSSNVGEERAVELLKLGVADFVLKDNLPRLVPAIERCLREKDARRAHAAAEKALRESESRYRAVVETTGDGIWILDARNRTTFVNPRMAEIAGYEVEEMLQDPITGFIEPVSLPRVRAHLERTQAGTAQRFDFRLARKDGRWVYCTFAATPMFDEEGNPSGVLGALTDITERVEAEEGLRRSERSLKEAQRVASVGHWEWSLLSGSVFWSEEHFRILEIPAGSVEPGYELFASLLDGDDRRALEEATQGAIESGGAGDISLDLNLTTPAGNRRAVGERVFVDRDESGTVIGFHGTIQDITERVAMENALRQRDAQLAEAQRIAHVGSWSLDLATLTVQATDELFRLFELTPVRGAPLSVFRERVHGDDRHILRLAISGLRNSSQIDITFRIVLQDGAVRIVRALGGRPHETTGGELLIGTLQDVTAQILAENVLLERTESLAAANRDLQREMASRLASEEAHRRLSTVVEQAAESIMITDVEGVIEYVNPAFERITGYTSAEAVGQTPRLLKSGTQDRAFYESLWDTISAGDPWTGHFVNRRKDGSFYEEEATITPVRNRDGVITNFTAIKRDVTAEVALQKQLRHAQKLEAIGTLAGGVAHDFNNLLQGMLSILQVLRRTSATPPVRADSLVEQLELTVRRGAQLTRQLLLFARREASQRETSSLSEILTTLTPFLQRVVRENIRLSIKPASSPLWLHADRGQIEQVVMNLVVNAMDAMPAGGDLFIQASARNGQIVLEVADTGTGIPEKIRNRIFEPFFTTKGVGKGTGLGLSVVHGIVTGHLGSITVDCPPEGGTVFRIVLPANSGRKPPTEPPVAPDLIPNGNGELVLVVEDDETARAGLIVVLELFGYHVKAASTGEEAVALGPAAPFSAVVSDLMLPGIPGTEVVRRLRQQRPELKAVLMSGYAAPEVVSEGIETNEFHFLQKPFDGASLARVLHTLLRA